MLCVVMRPCGAGTCLCYCAGGNPGATLADFNRWHSPRDWVPFKQGDGEAGRHPEGAVLVDWNAQPAGCLGPRMRGADNPWRVAWEQALRTTLPTTAVRRYPGGGACVELFRNAHAWAPGDAGAYGKRCCGWASTHLGVDDGNSAALLPSVLYVLHSTCPDLAASSRNYKINALA